MHKRTKAKPLDEVDAITLTVAQRRQQVMELWLRGYGVRDMARALGRDDSTISQDLIAIRRNLATERLETLEERLNRSVAARHKLQQEAWQLFARLPDNSTNKVGVLNSILMAQDKIDELDGLIAPDRVNAATIAEVWDSVTGTIHDLFGEEALQAFLLAQRERIQSGHAQRLLTEADLPALPRGVRQKAQVVEADATPQGEDA